MTTKSTTRRYFYIKDCPGLFRLGSAWMQTLEKNINHLIFEPTLIATKKNERGAPIGGTEPFKAQFHTALIGATSGLGYGSIRLLGRFVLNAHLVSRFGINPKFVSELATWQWEAVFNPHSRGSEHVGFVAKLSHPLPDDWTR